MKHIRWLVWCAIGAASVAGFFLYAFPELRPDWLDGEPEIIVQTVRARQAARPVTVRVTGKLLPLNEVDIVSRLTGKVTEIRFKVGDAVSPEAVVATIQSDAVARRLAEIEASLREARDALQASEAQLDDAEKQLARSREWYEQDLIARSDVEQTAATAETARAQAELARARVAQQQAMLGQARALERFTRLTAPVGGVVVRRWVEPGATVAESSPILTLGQGDTLKLAARIAEPYADNIRAGMTGEVTDAAAPDRIFPGTVVRVEPHMSGGQRAVDVEIHVGSRGQLRAGMMVQATITFNADEQAIWVPRRAVVSAQGGVTFINLPAAEPSVRKLASPRSMTTK